MRFPDGWFLDESGASISDAQIAPTDIAAAAAGLCIATLQLLHPHWTLNNLLACLIATDILQVLAANPETVPAFEGPNNIWMLEYIDRNLQLPGSFCAVTRLHALQRTAKHILGVQDSHGRFSVQFAVHMFKGPAHCRSRLMERDESLAVGLCS